MAPYTSKQVYKLYQQMIIQNFVSSFTDFVNYFTQIPDLLKNIFDEAVNNFNFIKSGPLSYIFLIFYIRKWEVCIRHFRPVLRCKGSPGEKHSRHCLNCKLSQLLLHRAPFLLQRTTGIHRVSQTAS